MLISAEQKSKIKNAFLPRRRVYISIQDKKTYVHSEAYKLLRTQSFCFFFFLQRQEGKQGERTLLSDVVV